MKKLLSGDRQRFARSTSISLIDPAGFFCTLRCAARYGVKAATLRRESIDKQAAAKKEETK